MLRAMVMAAGLGKRLQPVTHYLPKPMVPVCNRPVMHHLLSLLARHGFGEVAVNLHYFPETIRGYFGDDARGLGVTMHYRFEPELRGTAGGVKGFESLLGDGTFLVTSADGLHDVDLTALLAYHRAKGALATSVVKRVDDPSLYGVAMVDDEMRVTGFQEKPSRGTERSDLCNCGIYVFEPEIFEHIPADQEFDFGLQLLPELAANGASFYAYVTGAYWNDVGNLDELRSSNFDALMGRVGVTLPGDEIMPGVWAERDVQVAPEAQLTGPILLGQGAVIEAGAELVGPSVIGAGARVGRDSAVKEALILPGAEIPPEGLSIAGIFGDARHLAESWRTS